MTDEPPSHIEPGDAALGALLERHGLGAAASVQTLRAVGSARTLLVNDALLVRLSDDPATTLRWRKAAQIYRRLQRVTDVPCPEFYALDTQRDGLPFDALITSYIAGERADAVWPALDLPTREMLSEELGRICGTLHRLAWPVYGSVDPADPAAHVSARWTDIINARVRWLYARSEASGVLPLAVLDDLLAVLNDGDALFDTPSTPVLTHNDFGLWNVILRHDGAAWQVAGLIGWDAALLADAAWEFANLARRPVDSYPMGDGFSYGYRERRPLQDDLSVRRRLYRLLVFWECALESAEQLGPSAETTQWYRLGILRLLAPR